MRDVVNTAIAFTFAAGLVLGMANVASAAGEASSDSGSSETATDPAKATASKCPDGQVFDPEVKNFMGVKVGKCVASADVKKNDKQGFIYDYGKSLAKAGHYNEAIAALRLAPDQGDPRVLNYLGYSHRKLGRMDEALGYYQAAIAKNPDFSLVREYLGEAYIQLGQLEKAREQLSEIERICGSKACGEYGQLAELIVDSQISQ